MGGNCWAAGVSEVLDKRDIDAWYGPLQPPTGGAA
jgi:hypothetical protein